MRIKKHEGKYFPNLTISPQPGSMEDLVNLLDDISLACNTIISHIPHLGCIRSLISLFSPTRIAEFPWA